MLRAAADATAGLENNKNRTGAPPPAVKNTAPGWQAARRRARALDRSACVGVGCAVRQTHAAPVRCLPDAASPDSASGWYHSRSGYVCSEARFFICGSLMGRLTVAYGAPGGHAPLLPRFARPSKCPLPIIRHMTCLQQRSHVHPTLPPPGLSPRTSLHWACLRLTS